MGVYIKTYFYEEHEPKYLIANLMECFPYIDGMFAFEYNINHTGRSRNFKFDNGRIYDIIPKEFHTKFRYIPCDLQPYAKDAFNNEDLIHSFNEPLMRSWFSQIIKWSPEDIILSIDADEIFFGDKIPYLIEQVEKYKIVRCKMHSFYWKETYLWKNKIWKSPLAAKYGAVHPKYPNNWRDMGNLTDAYVGSHFSWCNMSVELMQNKAQTFSHPQWRNKTTKEILKDCIENKKHPFPNVQFDIEELDKSDNRIPDSIRKLGFYEINFD